MNTNVVLEITTTESASATGTGYVTSNSPFAIITTDGISMSERSLRGNPIAWVREGQPFAVVPGASPVLIGGNRYSTVANGQSSPACAATGEVWVLQSRGDEHSFARWIRVGLVPLPASLIEAITNIVGDTDASRRRTRLALLSLTLAV